MIDWKSAVLGRSKFEFISEFEHPFLLLLDDVNDDPFAFRTTMVSRSTAPFDGNEEQVRGGAVFAVSKSSANPYEGRIIVGRAKNCDIVLREKSISKVHAHFTVNGPESGTLTDAGSSNGCIVDGEKLEPGQPMALVAGAKIVFGRLPAVFLSPAQLYRALR